MSTSGMASYTAWAIRYPWHVSGPKESHYPLDKHGYCKCTCKYCKAKGKHMHTKRNPTIHEVGRKKSNEFINKAFESAAKGDEGHVNYYLEQADRFHDVPVTTIRDVYNTLRKSLSANEFLRLIHNPSKLLKKKGYKLVLKNPGITWHRERVDKYSRLSSGRQGHAATFFAGKRSAHEDSVQEMLKRGKK